MSAKPYPAVNVETGETEEMTRLQAIRAFAIGTHTHPYAPEEPTETPAGEPEEEPAKKPAKKATAKK